MKNIQLITRADDAGSSRSANAAIAQTVRRGFIRNVSVMAPCAYLNNAASLLADNKDICIGMHATLNAEWDKVKWVPVSNLPESSGLVDKDGYFLPDPKLFRDTKPPVELIMREYEAQLDKLTRAGFNVTYIDSHMLPELHIPELDEATADFAKRKGLLDHMYYYNLPSNLPDNAKAKSSFSAMRSVPDGQYFFVIHPAEFSEEMLSTGNSTISGESVARQRAEEAENFSMPGIKFIMRMSGVRPLRYDEAVPLQTRLTPRDLSRFF